MSVSIRHTVSPTMTEEEQKLLRSIGAVRRYPVCRFELRSSKDRELCSVALDAVHKREDYLFDRAFLKKGQAVLTVKGRYALQQIAEKE